MSKDSGSVLGGVLLICGSCIGAGMLGLPIITGLAGFVPSLFGFFAAWLFMTLTGLLLVEATGWFPHRSNMITMVGHTLGKVGKMLSWVLYLFLFYALLVAYVSGSGQIFASFTGLPVWSCSLLFILLFGWIVYFGTRAVDLCNRWLVLGLIIAYLALVFLGLQKVDITLLLHSIPTYAFIALPVLVVSFGYHNMVPTLTTYMKGDLKKVRLTILLGSLLALLIYLLWEVIVMGIVPYNGSFGILDSYLHGREGADSLSRALGSSWVTFFAQAFAFFAILTSFLAQGLGLVHFLSDGFQIKYRRRENIWMCVSVFIPPLFFALVQPQIFFSALSLGGVIAASLFGIIPVLMIWRGRYLLKLGRSYRVFGGKPLLVAIFLFALLICVFHIANMVDAPFLPKPTGAHVVST